MRHLSTSLLAALVWLLTLAEARAEKPADLDAEVQRAMQAFEVPGVGLAIVEDGHVVVAKGYGVRRLGETAPVDEHTLFGIASNTKAFTATSLGLLVERGLVEWDAPVIRYLPWFQMWDPFVTRELTVRDLLVHRSGLGLGAGDLLWWPPSTYDRDTIARRLRFIEPATSFRSAYAYDTFVVRWRDRELRAGAFVTFALDPRGEIASARMEAVSPATDFSFDFQDLRLVPVH